MAINSDNTLRIDRRATDIHHLDEVYAMPAYPTLDAWASRAVALREQILVAAGLYPQPEKASLNANIFGRVERDGYTIEKVMLRTLPGFYLCGNLFRPQNQTAPCPGILHPHGHTPLQEGRLFAAEAMGSTLTRLGCVVFIYDMVGYVDSNQIPHTYGGTREELWGISLLGLQLWNSIRATDFLSSLPEVDPARIGCAGASGGGTQTFLLSAVDERIRVAVPAVMVSSFMQGGCRCENAPGLRIDTNNMEIAALTAPRPMLLVGATGDWTCRTPEVEYPAIRSIYRLFGAEEKIAYTMIEGPHGYERPHREAAYAWLARWLLGIDNPEQCREGIYPQDRRLDLLVFYGMKPPRRLDETQLTAQLITTSKRRIQSLRPHDAGSLQRLSETLGVALRHALAVEAPSTGDIIFETGDTQTREVGAFTPLVLGRKGRGDAIPATLLEPKTPVNTTGVLLVDEQGMQTVIDLHTGMPSSLAYACLQRGNTVLTLDCFATGSSPAPELRYKYPETYNRTITAYRVQDILTAIVYMKQRGCSRTVVVASGMAGLWAMLAAGVTAPDVLVADATEFNRDNDQSFLAHCHVPGLRHAGDFETACALAHPCRLLIHNTGDVFRLRWTPDLYRNINTSSCTLLFEPAQPEIIIAWLSEK
ncbi:MAG: alpha/beta hydrolase family protein [Armatimonadota bacterium]